VYLPALFNTSEEKKNLSLIEKQRVLLVTQVSFYLCYEWNLLNRTILQCRLVEWKAPYFHRDKKLQGEWIRDDEREGEEMTNDSQWRACKNHPFQGSTSGCYQDPSSCTRVTDVTVIADTQNGTEPRGGATRAFRTHVHAQKRISERDPRDAHGALSRRERRDFSASNVRTCMRTCVVAVVVVVVESSLAHTGPPLRWPRTNNSHGVATSERERTLYIYVRCCVYVLKYVYTPLLRARKADWNIQRQLGRRVATLLFFSLSLSFSVSLESIMGSEWDQETGWYSSILILRLS